MQLFVSEIFYSIQGESLYAGLPCVLIRLCGCNLRCRYCDTVYAHTGGRNLSLEAIVEEVRAFGCPLVEVTGGEPLFQQDSPALVSRLLEQDYTVLLETNGSFNISMVDSRCIKVVDMKCPGSGECEKNDYSNLDLLAGLDQLKFVITGKKDYEWAKSLLTSKWGNTLPVPVLFSPASGLLEPARLAEWILQDRLPVRLQLQLHKILWPEAERGV
ncbi:MAG: radical SAM protein [Desulfosalsimonadaceae bacterium]